MSTLKKTVSILLIMAVLISSAVIAGFSAIADGKIVYFNSYSKADRKDYGDAPDEVVYNENGSVTLISDERWSAQHQVVFNLTDSKAMADALALAQSDDGDGTLQIAVTINKCAQMLASGVIEDDKAAEINVDINISQAARDEGRSNLHVQQWQSVRTTKYYRFDCLDYKPEDFVSIRLNIMNYSFGGGSDKGAGGFEITFTQVYSTDGEPIPVSSFTLPTVDPNLKTAPFLVFDKNNKNDYGNPPDSDKYDENGVTLKSINCKTQHQLNYKMDKDTVNTALAIANGPNGTGKIKMDVTVVSAEDEGGQQGYCEVSANLFIKEDNSGYKPPESPSIQYWQEVGTTVTYYFDVSQIRSFDNVSNFRIAAQNYWKYNSKRQLIEAPWDKPGEYWVYDSTGTKVAYDKPEDEVLTSAIIAPVVYFSNVSVAETYEEPDYYYPGRENSTGVMYGDCNGDKAVNAKDMLMLRKYLAQHNPEGFVQENADVAYDQTVNAKDLLRLRQYLADWDVLLGK